MAKLQYNEFLPNYTVRQMHQKMVESGLISGGHIQPGPDMAGDENLAGFRPGPDMMSGATLVQKVFGMHKLTESHTKSHHSTCYSCHCAHNITNKYKELHNERQRDV